MYSIQGELTGSGDRVVRIEGRLAACAEVEAELCCEIVKLRNNGDPLTADDVVVDLSRVESISEDCLTMFHRVKEVYHIRFKGYSLFVEAQLSDRRLLG